MKNLNKRTEFEEQFRQTFDGAEITPPEGAWDKIDAALSKGETVLLRKRAAWYKLLAAASIAFAMGAGIFSISYVLNSDSRQPVISQQGAEMPGARSREESIRQDMADDVAGEGTRQGNKISSSPADHLAWNGQQTAGEDPGKGKAGNKNITHPQNSGQKMAGSSWKVDQKQALGFGGNALVATADLQGHETGQRVYLAFNELQPLGITAEDDAYIYQLDHIYKVPYIPTGAFKKKKKNDAQNGPILLAGLDFSAGMFDPNFQNGASAVNTGSASNYKLNAARNQLTTFNTANKDFLVVRSTGQEVEPEFAYSYGANVGIKIINRLILQTGFAYRKANSTIRTTGYFADATGAKNIPIVASYSYQLDGLSSVKRVPETTLSNQYEFTSIPVRLGYILLDKKFNITILAGMSPEFFLKNKIADNSGFLNTLFTESGSESPYKNVYFNGSLGTMFGYTFAGQYSITVEPQYRVALNSFMKDDFYLSSYPSSFMVSFGVSYNFK